MTSAKRLITWQWPLEASAGRWTGPTRMRRKVDCLFLVLKGSNRGPSAATKRRMAMEPARWWTSEDGSQKSEHGGLCAIVFSTTRGPTTDGAARKWSSEKCTRAPTSALYPRRPDSGPRGARVSVACAPGGPITNLPHCSHPMRSRFSRLGCRGRLTKARADARRGGGGSHKSLGGFRDSSTGRR